MRWSIGLAYGSIYACCAVYLVAAAQEQKSESAFISREIRLGVQKNRRNKVGCAKIQVMCVFPVIFIEFFQELST
jgi:hypothetical protein